MPERIRLFLEEIGTQIRWKRARPVLLGELETHAEEQLAACLEEGLSQEEAELETLRQLGDPVEIGQQLDELHRPKPQRGLLILTGCLVLAGVLMQLTLLGSRDAAKWLLFTALGFGALFAGYLTDVRQLVRHSDWLLISALVLWLLLYAASPTINHVAYYAGYVTMLYPALYGLLLCRLRRNGWQGFIIATLWLVPLAISICLVPRILDLTALLATAGLLLLTAAWDDWFCIGRRKGMTAVCGLGGLLAFWIFALLVRGYGLQRLTIALHPQQDPQGSGYMGSVIRSALEGSRLWGPGEMTGRWAGMDYWQIMPESATDAFLVSVIHQLGWLPLLLLVCGLLALMGWAAGKCLRQKNAPARPFVLAILTMFGVRICMSLLLTGGVVVLGGFCPLLKMSAETVLQMGLMGLLLAVFRQETLPFPGVVCQPHPARGHWKLVYVPSEQDMEASE